MPDAGIADAETVKSTAAGVAPGPFGLPTVAILEMMEPGLTASTVTSKTISTLPLAGNANTRYI